MNIFTPFSRTQSEIKNEIEQRLRDPENNRWSNAEIYRAINDALLDWSQRVRIPYLYTISGGWVAGTYEYALPDYISEPIEPQIQRILPKYLGSGITSFDNSIYTWVPIAGWELEPTATGGKLLRLNHSPDTLDGRIIWYGRNSMVPITLPALNASITSSDTSLTLSTKPLVERSGYIKINAEWMQYGGVTEGSSTLTLTNLVRGVNGTTAASHSSADSVEWGVVAHRIDLYNQLYHRAMASLYGLYLTDASPAEADHMEFQMRYCQQMADDFWKGYSNPRGAKMILSRQSVGEFW